MKELILGLTFTDYRSHVLGLLKEDRREALDLQLVLSNKAKYNADHLYLADEGIFLRCNAGTGDRLPVVIQNQNGRPIDLTHRFEHTASKQGDVEIYVSRPIPWSRLRARF